MNDYSKVSYPHNNGLICGAFFCKPNSEKFNELFDAWWDEIENKSVRDQLSFNYVLWVLNLDVFFINGNINKNSYFSTEHHKKNIFNNASLSSKLRNFFALLVFKLLSIKNNQ